MKRLFFLCALSAALPLAGCASTSPDGAFRSAARAVYERSGERIAWLEASDAAVDKRVSELLAGDLDVDKAVAVALLRNAALRATYEDLSVAQADLVQAGLLSNPMLSGSLAFPLDGDVARGASLGIAEDIVSLFTLAARKRIAGAALEAAKARVAHAVLEAVYQTRAAFYSFQSAAQTRAMRQTVVDAEDAAFDLMRRQEEAGNASELDLANQASLSGQSQVDLLRSDADITGARETLTRAMGVWRREAEYTVAAKLPELPAGDPAPESVESLALSRRLDLAAARAERVAAEEALSLVKKTRFVSQATVGGSLDRAPERYTTLGPSASLELPIFDQKQAVVARHEAELRRALAKEKALAIDIRSEARVAIARVKAARGLVERYRSSIVPLRERALALSREENNAMLLSPYQLLFAKQNAVNAYREFIEALRDYWIARADLERATGGRLPAPSPSGAHP